MKRVEILLNQNECIAAIATPFAKGGLGVIRISGKNAIEIASKIFKPTKIESLNCLKGYEAAYGFIFDFKRCKVDDAVALVFREPHSYTGEDVVELSCHGGLAVLSLILKLCFQAGCRPALNGEFTKRAFLNGKISLTQAEAIIDLINAESSLSLKSAVKLKDGFLFKKTQKMCSILIDINTQLEAFLNYPDEDVEEPNVKEIIKKIQQVIDELSELIVNCSNSSCFKNGVRTILTGAPNVGKSTLMNLIVGEDVSIINEMSGTTRDVITKQIEIERVAFTFFDTAGIREASNEVERLGIARAKKEQKQADLILFVVDGSKKFVDVNLLNDVQKQADTLKILILNKVDLGKNLDINQFKNFDSIVETTNRNLDTIQQLKNTVVNLVKTKLVNFSLDVFVNERQKIVIEKLIKELKEIKVAFEQGVGLDALSFSLELAIEKILELNGQKVSDEIIDGIFSKFCVGK